MTNPVNVPQLAHAARPVVEIRDGQAITTSIEVARVFGKQHRHVLDSIRTLLTNMPEDRLPNFRQTVEARPNPSGGEPIKSITYLLTKDGVALLTFGFTGKRALAFKLAYIDAFNKMEAALTKKAQAQSASEPHKALSPVVAKEIAAEASRSILDALQRQNMLVDWAQVIDSLTDRNSTITLHELTDVIHASLTRLQRNINSEVHQCIARRAANQGVSTMQVSLNA